MAKKSIETMIKEKMTLLEESGKATGRKAVYPNIEMCIPDDKASFRFEDYTRSSFQHHSLRKNEKEQLFL